MSEQTPAEAGTAGAREDACRDYQSSLEDLTFNSKPHINMLTILAEENLPFAKEIVSLIEAQTAKAPSSEKLPVMYLMDSIVKNVGREYLTAFTKNLVATFICVFEKPEEPSTPGTVVSSPSISTPPIVPDIQKNLTQEQLIRQQLLAKQKQLLELQQKKLELELEQAKAQLAVSLSVQQETSNLGPGSAPSKLHVSQIPPMAVKTPHQVPMQPEKGRPGPSLQIQDLKGTNRDPRLNRMSQHSSHGKDQSHRKEFLMNPLNQSDIKTSKTIPSEKLNSSKQEKSKSGEKTKKELDQLDSKSKSKSKSPSPLKNKLSHTKDLKNQESECPRVSDMSKRDPRLKKHLQDKTDSKDDDIKEKRKTTEKKDKDEHMKSSEHRLVGSRNKIVNGIVQKQDTITDELEKQGTKPGRSSTRKRSRSRSPKSRSPIIHSPKRRDRRSPKRRQRSMSPTLTPKPGKMRQPGCKQSHMEEFMPPSREERNAKRSTKQDIRDPRRMKKTEEDRPQEAANQHSTKSGTEPKENVENWQSSKSTKRWKSGWEENKSIQQGDEHSKSPHSRHRETWPSTKGILSPRAPKQQHRLSVDANLQIPKELTLASKRELLQKTSERLASGEITQDEFLLVVHQIRQLFQYQEGVREEQRSPFNDRFPLKRPRYDDSDKPFVDSPASRFAGLDTNQRLTALAEDRPLFDGPSRPSVTRDGPTKMIFEGPNKLSPRIDGPPTPGSLRFDGSPGQMGGGGPLRFEGPQSQLGGGCPLRFEGPPGPVGTPLRFEGPIGQGGGGGFRFEGSPGLRFEGSAGSLRFEGPGGQPVGGLRFEGHRGQPVGGLRFEGPHGQPVGGLRFDNPRGQPIGGLRFEGGHGPSGPAIRFDGPHGQPAGGIRFEGPLLQQGVGMRFDGPHGQSVAGLRFEGQHNQLGGNLRFEGPHGQPGVGIRFEGPLVQQGGGMRFEGPVPGGGLRIEGPLGQGGPRFDGCHALRFDGQPGQPSLLPRFDGLHGQPGPRFERTGQPGPQRFDGPPGQQVQPRFDGVPQRFDGPQHQQASRFDIPLGLQGARFDNHPSQRLESVSFNQTGPYNDPPGNAFNAPSQGLQFQRHEQIFDSPQGPNFNGPHGPGNQSFSNPLNRASGHYFDEKNLQSSQFGNFGNLPAPITVGNIQGSQQVLTGVAQPVSFGQGQQFLPVHPQNLGAFVQNPSGALPKAYPDNHLSQVDVNELFSKLLKTGILKLSQPDSATTQVNEVAAQPSTEEEEDQNEDQDVPDLTNFTIEELKQRYDSVINRLYTGIQCYSCGMRFTTSQTDVYADHLDWHYRQNRTEKDVSRKVTHRRWYYSLTDWIEFEEIADLEERAKSQFFEKVHEEVVLKTQEAAKEKEFQSVPAGPAGAVESCEICQEQFEQYWDEEEEEWHLKNAIRVDGKIYHPSCYEDYQNTSSFDCTPSPSKTPVENPLNIMLNIVKNELQEPSESPKVKEEQIDTPPACTEESMATPTEIKTENDPVESV
ncbi:PCF11 cleavage and polyadenylation factor subunit [Phyllostomus discolor]|uniref:PCF11 cleavage and polyadenylation factor subunit n=1 Tax=Phyllostomus discolor TaxID=89673 RepID=A0A834A699_9CHIR|nr:PCF11 cleavage and polyadenylation factor subunit [Phyllostomus discolor]